VLLILLQNSELEEYLKSKIIQKGSNNSV